MTGDSLPAVHLAQHGEARAGGDEVLHGRHAQLVAPQDHQVKDRKVRRNKKKGGDKKRRWRINEGKNKRKKNGRMGGKGKKNKGKTSDKELVVGRNNGKKKRRKRKNDMRDMRNTRLLKKK